MPDSPVLALIAAWNEAPLIGPVIEKTLQYTPVLVVDDGSSDGTAAVARQAGATVVCHDLNRGKGAALRTGFSAGMAQGYESILTLDADGQHDPDDIPKFLRAGRRSPWDLIVGRRDFAQMPFPRGYTNPFGSWLLSLALGERIPDNQSGFRLHRRSLLEALELRSSGFEMEVEVIVQAVCLEMSIGWVDIRTIYDVNKQSYFRPIVDSARFLGMVWHAWRRRRAGSAEPS